MPATDVPALQGKSGEEMPALDGIRVVASDLDGTFLSPSHQAPEENLKALREAEAAGIRVVIATGRARFSAQGKLPDLDLSRRPGIYLNGALVCGSTGAVVHERKVPRDVVADVLRFVRDREGRRERLGVVLSLGDTAWVPTPAEEWCLHLRKVYEDPLPGDLGGYDAAIGEFSTVCEEGEPAQKRSRREEPHLLHILATSSDLDALRDDLEALCAGRVKVLKVLPTCITLLHPLCSKADGLAPVIQEMGFSFQETLAVGDAENDLEMLRSAHVGVAMGNAFAKVKEITPWQCATNDADPPGVSRVLRAVISSRGGREIPTSRS